MNRNKELLDGTFKIVSHGTGKFGRVWGSFCRNREWTTECK